MRKVPVHEAVGQPLGHDVTEVSFERGVKHRAFKRGHVIEAADVERLLDLGKKAVFVLEENETEVHEDDAARRIAPLVAGPNVVFDPDPYEGKITFRASCAGVFTVDPERLYALNDLEIPSLPTLPSFHPVVADQPVGAFRIIPLTCEERIVAAAESLLTEPLLAVHPYVVRSAGILVTGTEVFEGRITDGFIPRLAATLAGHGVPVTATDIVPDDRTRIEEAVRRLGGACDILLVTGGTSVDPDDVTVAAMRAAGVTTIMKGMPVQPGNNFTLGRLDGRYVCAVPAATLFFKATALDLLLPRLLAGLEVTREQLVRLGHGGLAQPGAEQHFPDCTFGTGR
ncbi:molybdopterin-binding protein [bacterium]|nr:molybdopterin-binding protein [bacterium]